MAARVSVTPWVLPEARLRSRPPAYRGGPHRLRWGPSYAEHAKGAALARAAATAVGPRGAPRA